MATRLPGSWELPQVFRDRLGQDAGRQRTMAHDEHVLVILHEIPRRGVLRSEGLFFWRNPEGMWRSSTGGTGLGALNALVARYEAALAELEGDLEAAQRATDYFVVLKRATPLRRAADNLWLALQAAREAAKLDKAIITLRDRAGDLDRAFELLVEDARNALDVAMARQVEEQNRTSHELAKSAQQLNRLMALFVPLTAAASLFSMKLDSGLDTSSVAWFWGVLLGGLALGVAFTRRGRLAPPGKVAVEEEAAPFGMPRRADLPLARP